MDEKTTAIEVRKPEALIPDARNIRILATDLFNSRMFRGINSVPEAITVMQFGNEIGLGPVQSLTHIKPIKGQMTMSARLIMGMAASKGVTWTVKECTDKRCEIVFYRKNWDHIVSVFTIDEAEKAGLVKPDSGWEKYPQDMLFARAGSRGVRRIAPDAAFGMYSTEEIQDAEILEEGHGPVQEVPSKAPGSPVEAFPEDTPAGREEEAPLFPGDEETDETIAQIAARAEDEAVGKASSPAMETAILAIKSRLDSDGVDERSFKEWLFKYQNALRPVRAYVGKIGKSIRFHLGKEQDVVSLSRSETIGKAIIAFRTGKEPNGKK